MPDDTQRKCPKCFGFALDHKRTIRHKGGMRTRRFVCQDCAEISETQELEPKATGRKAELR